MGDALWSLCGALALFLYGMLTLSQHLEALGAARARRLLGRATASLPRSLLLGAGITVALQSSSAMTGLLVGLVNAGALTLAQAPGLIMGSNIGTTLTPWLLALTGLEGQSPLLEWLRLRNLAILPLLAGVMLRLSAQPRRQHWGQVLSGFALLILGMEGMSQAGSRVAELPQAARLLSSFRNPAAGLLGGTLFTGLIQSSAASVGLLQSLAQGGTVTWAMAIPVVLGQNIGTCVTALLAALGTTPAARQTAWLHLAFNLWGAAVWMAALVWVRPLCPWLETPVFAGGIALCHTAFNLITTLLLLPLYRPLTRRLAAPA